MFSRLSRAAAPLAGTLCAACALVLARPAAVPAAGPDVSYDEIIKFAIGAKAPPPGQFAGDYAVITAPVQSAPKKRGLFGALSVGDIARGLAGGGIGGAANAAAGDAASNAAANAIGNAVDASMQPLVAQLQRFGNGLLERHAFYNGWERVDDVAANTATILKCAEHQRITLDLTHKTYRIDDPSAPESGSTASAASNARSPSCRTAPVASAPGTGTLAITSRTSGLAPLTLDGTSANGYRSTSTIAVENATGSCKNGSFSVEQTAYYSGYDVPRPLCPLPKSLRYPRSPSEMVTSSKTKGCSLRPTLHVAGPAQPQGKLALYELMTMGANSPQSFGVAIERGHVHHLGPADAARFEIPSDFRQVK